MVITCPSCSARYRLNPDKIEGRGAKITCPKCSHVFVVFTDPSDAVAREPAAPSPLAAPPRPSVAPAPSAAPRVQPQVRPVAAPGASGDLDAATTTGAFRAVGFDEESVPSSTSSNIRIVAPRPRSARRLGAVDTGRFGPSTDDEPGSPELDAGGAAPYDGPEIKSAADLDFRSVGIKTWKVKVAIGLIYDFSDISTIKKYLADKKVTPDDLISHDSERWLRIGDIPSLEQHFIETWKLAKAAVDRGDAPVPAAKKKTTGTHSTLGHQSATVPAIATSTGTHRVDSSPSGTGDASDKKRRRAAAAAEAAEVQAVVSRRPKLLAALVIIVVVGLLAVWRLAPTDRAVEVVEAVPIPVNELGPSDDELAKIKEKIRVQLENDRHNAEGSPPTEEEDPALVEEKERNLIPVRPEDHKTASPTPPPVAVRSPPAGQGGAARPTPTPERIVQVTENRSDPSAMYLKVGRSKLAGGDYGSAVKAFETAIAKRGDCGECYAGLAEAQKQLGNGDAAAAATRKAAELGQPQSLASP